MFIELWLGFSKFSKRKQHAEIKIEDEIAKALEEKWYVYGPDKKEEVHKYISERWVHFLNL